MIHWVGVSEITVKVHRAAAVRKMSAHSLAELVRQWDIIAADGYLTPSKARDQK